jgi:DNA-directed RNA polymerase subunit alpha
MTQLKIECIESKIEYSAQHYGCFVIEPLKVGQGLTVGNALRRSLLSDLVGTSIIATRIKYQITPGSPFEFITHEFMTIPSVREDILELLLNIKGIVLRCQENLQDAPQNNKLASLTYTGPGDITAEWLQLPDGISLLNPEAHIATLSSAVTLEFEFQIQQGTGYTLSAKNAISSTSNSSFMLSNQKDNFLPVDAIFMPVRKVNYNVEEIVTDNVIQDRLLMEIWTNGSVSPEEGLVQSSENLCALFAPIVQFSTQSKIVIDVEKEVNEKLSAKPILIEELHLSPRAYNCLKKVKINTVSDLLEYSREELLQIQHFGEKSAKEVEEALQNHLGIILQ